MRQKRIIDAAAFERIRPTGMIIPRLLGIPKTHKEGLPLRPTLEMSNSSYHMTPKWLTGLLEPVRLAVSFRDSFDLVERISNSNLSG